MIDETKLQRLKTEMDAARKAAQVAGDAWDAARAAARAADAAWEAERAAYAAAWAAWAAWEEEEGEI